jgi:hypothetical protein
MAIGRKEVPISETTTKNKTVYFITDPKLSLTGFIIAELSY